MAVPYASNFDYTKPFSDVGAKIQLAANTAVSWAIPGANNIKYRAEFSFNNNDDIWVAINQTAAIPTPGAAVDTNQQELRPGPRYVKGGDVLSFICTTAGVQCGVTLLGLPSTAP